MNKIKRLFLKILQGNVIYDDNIVPVIIKDYWFDTTPCITIHGYVRKKGDYNRYYTTVQRPLDDEHPLYDNENPIKKYLILQNQQNILIVFRLMFGAIMKEKGKK